MRMWYVSRASAALSAVALALPIALAADVSVVPGPGSNQVLYGSTVLQTTSNPIVSAQVVEIPNGTGVAVLWTEQDASGTTPWYAFSLDGSTFSHPIPTSNDLMLRYATFDPSATAPEIPAALQAGPNNTTYIVQFDIQPLEAYQNVISALGGEIFTFIPSNALAVGLTPEALSGVVALPYVRAVTPFHPAFKLDESILAQLAGGDVTDGSARYSIEVFARGQVHQAPVAAAINAMGGQVHYTTEDSFRFEATLTLAQVLEVAAMSEVHFIDPWGPGSHDMNIVRQNVGAVPTLSGAGFTGQGVRGEVFDTETQSNHPQWNGQVPLLHGVNGNSGSHGTACYGINFATGTGDVNATGMQPSREQGIFCWYTQVTQFGGATTRLTFNTQAVDPNGTFRSIWQTSSVGSPQTVAYTTISTETDDYLFQVDYCSFQSQSNTGNQNSRPQAWAKNIVSVGGVDIKETVNKADDSSAGASIGPAQDGRVKPDLCNSYLGIYTTWPTSTYTQFSGTSGATPITAGCGGLIMQMWHSGVWKGHGGKANVFLSRPKSTTVKGLLVNTSYKYPLNQLGLTRAVQGWGLPDLAKAYNSRDNTYVVNETHSICPGGTNTYKISVPSGQPELAVTMVYLDPKGPTSATQHRINDLSLKVTDPTGLVYWGNNGLTASNTSPVGGAANTKDTVENVFLNNPAAGVWTVEILGSEITQDARKETAAIDADYALIFRGKGTAVIGCPGDIDLDGSVGQSDLGILLAAYGTSACGAGFNPLADLDGDGAVGQSDLGILLGNYGSICQ